MRNAEASVNAWTGPLKVFSIGMPVAFAGVGGGGESGGAGRIVTEQG